MKLAALIVLAAVADTATMLLLPKGSEQNHLAVFLPAIAIGLKLSLALILAALSLRGFRYFRKVGVLAVIAWSIGVAANLVVIL